MRLKRLVATVSAGFEGFVASVENHEAVAESLIDDVRRSAAAVRVQQSRVQSQVSRLQGQRAGLDAELRRWNERAAELAGQDETTALECLRRARRIEARLTAIEAQLDAHLCLVDELRERRADLEQRLNDLQLRRTALSSRASSARALKTRADAGDTAELVFDRWETAVLTDEYRGEPSPDSLDPTGVDSLEREFREREETTELRARLALLTAARSGGA